MSQRLDSVITSLKPYVQYTVPNHIDRADVVAAKVREERTQADENLAKSEAVEDWEFTAGYEAARTVDEPVGAQRDRFLGAGLKIPLPVRKKGAGRIAEAKAHSEKAGHELAAKEANSLAEVAVRIAALRSIENTLNSLENKILPLLKVREEKTRMAYEQGLIEFNQVIFLRQQYSRTRNSLIEAKGEQAQALAMLQFALGSHPQLESFQASKCIPYREGTVPKDAPFALPVFVEPPSSPSSPKKPFKKLMRLLAGHKD